MPELIELGKDNSYTIITCGESKAWLIHGWAVKTEVFNNKVDMLNTLLKSAQFQYRRYKNNVQGKRDAYDRVKRLEEEIKEEENK